MPSPGAGEVLVRVGAAALNHLDVWVRRGLPIETTMPHIGGSDIAGTVEELGDGVTGVAAGTRVVVDPSVSCGECEWCMQGEEPLCVKYRILGEHMQGGFAEYVVVPARNLFAIPHDHPFESAAAAPLPFLTAWRALMGRAKLRAGESVLVTGASGGVATAAIQIAKYVGAEVFAVTSTPYVERVKALGAGTVYDRAEGDFALKLWHATDKRGVDVIIDSVGSATWKQNVRSLARRGRLVVYGGTTGPKVEIDVRQLFWKQTSILGSTMASRTEFETAMRLVFGGELKTVVDSVLPLEQIRDAHDRIEAGDVFGKIVLVP
ncbi:MAG TPA: alcohol dehydrogenase catalytic domain-containing protein [Longimicrobiales bacterium]